MFKLLNNIQGYVQNGYAGNHLMMADTGDSILGAAHTVSTADDFVPELWSDGIYRYFERGTVFKNLIEDFSSMVKGSGDTINIPQIDLVASADKAADSLVTYDATATTVTQLVINKHKYNAMLFEDMLMIQSNADLVAKYTQMFGEALARAVDADIWAELDGVNQGATLGTDDVLTDAEFQAALANLGENDVPYMDGGCSLVVNPTLMADILDPAAGVSRNFWRADAGGDGGVLTEGGTKGFIGKLFGINTYMSNTIATAGTAISGAIFHKSAAVCAVQQDVRVQAEYSIDALGTKVVADMIYGAKLIDSASNKKGYKFTNAS
tara:strand:- start:21682 stop:22650 length:969 start_codon:yes stop_codon:yes gene_type:complete